MGKSYFDQKCRICGCTWNHACNDHDYWYAENLCSVCAEKMKPILFNNEMVQALLDGRKTTTRRVIKPQPENKVVYIDGGYGEEKDSGVFMLNPLYCSDDILYVRETFGYSKDKYHRRVYKADLEFPQGRPRETLENGKWKSPYAMPKEAARIFLRVTDVKAERLQDITDDEAEAEGAVRVPLNDIEFAPARLNFAYIWDSTVKRPDLNKYGWLANPWVWVYTFQKIT